MAKAAAPYLHPRLSSIEHSGDNEAFRKAIDMTDDELAAIVSRAKLTLVPAAAPRPCGPAEKRHDRRNFDRTE